MYKILIVEDGMVIAFHLQKLLEAKGYQITDKVTFGEKVEASCKLNMPDLILMDIMLEGKMTGLEAAMLIRKTSLVPIIFMSALSDDETLKIIKECEYCYKIEKPFDEDKFLKKIEIVLKDK